MFEKLREAYRARQIKEWGKLRRSIETVEAARSRIDSDLEPETAQAFDAHHDHLRQRERRLYAKLSNSTEIVVH